VNRILSGRPKLKHYEAGMDLGLSFDPSESFRRFQGMIMDEYERMLETDRFVLMDGTMAVNKLQEQMRTMVGNRVDLTRFAPRQ
jgi:dTMP kinase